MSDKEEQIITKKKSDPDRESVFGHGFADIIDSYDWDETLRLVAEASDEDVRRVLAKAERNRKALTPEEFAILISEAADPYLEQMAELAHRFTLERFGKTISMYIPMYVSNACTNKCVYCGFNHDNPFTRTTLTMEQIEEECKAIKRLGPFENLLIVSGEYPSLCGVEYMERTLRTCRPYFHNLTIEIQPLRSVEYERLTHSGLNGVVCFQETYHREAYKKYHPRGMKSHYDWRLNGYDRMGGSPQDRARRVARSGGLASRCGDDGATSALLAEEILESEILGQFSPYASLRERLPAEGGYQRSGIGTSHLCLPSFRP